MLKPIIVLIAAATCVTACDAPTKSKAWEYRHDEDRLRHLTTTTAILESNENFGDRPDEPQMVMTITQGSAETSANGIVLSSSAYECRQPINIRVDAYPIQQLPGSTGGECLKLSPEDELAKRIMASKEVVMELDGAGGPQITFKTEGLELAAR